MSKSIEVRPGGEERERAIVVALRRIIRAVDLHSKRLVEAHGLTGPQLATLRVIERRGPISPAGIAARVHLSRGTVTGILARLEARGLVERRPDPADRRSVRMSLTSGGSELLARAPSLLQEEFRHELSKLEEWEQLSILATLQRIASMMDAADLDASPHLVTDDPVGGPAALPESTHGAPPRPDSEPAERARHEP